MNGFLSLSMGSVIVALHNVWTWPGVVLTVVGWLYVAKSLVAFTALRIGARSMKLVSEDDSARVRVAGVFLVTLGFFLLYVVIVASQYQEPGAGSLK